MAEYCDNDVIATEAVFNARKADFMAREILADVAGMTVNDTTNTLTARIIFGGNKKPQDQFQYRDMGDVSQIHDPDEDLPFAPVYTKRFQEIRDIRVLIKHKEFNKTRKMLGGALAKYLTDENAAANLARTLKIVINSVYGLTSAGFENPFCDNRNKDDIVAKHGSLFMINLKYEVINVALLLPILRRIPSKSLTLRQKSVMS